RYGLKTRKKRLLGTSDTVAVRTPLLTPVETMEAPVQVAPGCRLSARCKENPASHLSSTRFVPGNERMAIRGSASTVKLLVVVKLPWGVSTVMGPVLAASGITAVMRRSALVVGALVNMALVSLKSTRVAPLKLVPFRVTLCRQ